MTLVFTDYPPRTLRSLPRPSLGDLVAGLLRRGWTAWERHQQIARGAAELAQLDERMLRDIGLTHFDVIRIRSSTFCYPAD
ncbi:DUF1127 domain-containing protein [Belnapia sp. T18]|uniref:DUF1127 domain-containing protein n=1 Tax=Belnapia arida TaxID=2804533 RepID=A0ABS1U9K0_9PROT|nr:DUF1127 domain-containing protein [Belnapia arida]